MTTINTIANAPIGARVANLFDGLRARRAQYSVYRTTLRELQNLSERELNDLGMSRANIRAVAYKAAYEG